MPSTVPALPDDAESRWAALVARDVEADGRFVYAVRTTGVYCRPSCAARTPRRENVSFHPDGEAARSAGFRPCLRCRPDEAPLADRRRDAVTRGLALIGGGTILFLALYNVPLAFLATRSGTWPADVQSRSYLLDRLCGVKTDRLCPGPGVPLSLGSDSAYLGIDGDLVVPAGAAARLYGLPGGAKVAIQTLVSSPGW